MLEGHRRGLQDRIVITSFQRPLACLPEGGDTCYEHSECHRGRDGSRVLTAFWFRARVWVGFILVAVAMCCRRSRAGAEAGAVGREAPLSKPSKSKKPDLQSG